MKYLETDMVIKFLDFDIRPCEAEGWTVVWLPKEEELEVRPTVRGGLSLEQAKMKAIAYGMKFSLLHTLRVISYKPI